jgi:hypothetical protein
MAILALLKSVIIYAHNRRENPAPVALESVAVGA